MRKLLLSAAAIATVAIAGSASAQTVTSPNWTVSLGYGKISNDNTMYGAVTGRVAARLHPNFGVEGEASVGTGADIFVTAISRISSELKYDAAAYAVGYLPLSERFELYGRAGYGTTQVEAEDSRGKKVAVRQFGNGQSFNYGVGGSYYFTNASGVRLDWTRRDNVDTNINSDNYSISYTRRF